MLEDALNAHPSAECETIQDRPAEGDCICAERERFEDVLSPPYTSVDDDRDASGNGVGDARQDGDRRGNIVQRTSV
jgi:hypothetical protein